MEKINRNKLLTPAVKKIAVVLFVIIQTVLWFLIMFAKISVFNVSYFSLCLTFVYVIIFASHDKISAFQILAFAFTLIADYHLILLGGGDKVFAMVAFNVAQLFYALKTLAFANSRGEKLLQIILRVAGSIIGGVATILIVKPVQVLHVISVIYYVNLLISLVFSFIHFKGWLNQKLTAIGLLCFALCDVSIGFTFLIDIFSIPSGSILHSHTSLPVSMVNIFYYPSQLLLALSVTAGISKNKNQKEEL